MDSRKFFYEFGKAIYNIDAFYADIARKGNVSPTLLWVLYALNDGESHTQHEICVTWDLPKSTVNTVITELKEKGYVNLIPIKGKRREMTVSLTNEGTDYASKILESIYQTEEKVFAELDETDLSVTQTIIKITNLLKGNKL